MNSRVLKALLIIFYIVLFPSLTSGFELKTRFTTIYYEDEALLRKFNKKIYLGSLSYLLRNKQSITVSDEVANKVDVLIEKVETILEMFPRDVQFSIVLLASDREVQNIYRSKYRRSVDYIAFYSPRDRTIFVSVSDVRLGVLAHEIAHVIIDSYYGVRTPTKIHELLAQYVEEHLMD